MPSLSLAEKFYFYLLISSLLVTIILIPLGAYVRLSDAGLGCPDWPGCYGHWVPPNNHAEINQSNHLYPDQPLELDKAWKEMIHRYIAALLSVLIVVLSLAAFRAKRTQRVHPRSSMMTKVYIQVYPRLSLLLVGLVAFQALLGMWTITTLLRPLVVMGHLLGGMLLLAILSWMFANRHMVNFTFNQKTIAAAFSWLGTLTIITTVLLIAQIALGGWVSSNYAALICTDFPTCQNSWWPKMDFVSGFTLFRDLGLTADRKELSAEALMAIHWAHRINAYVLTLIASIMLIKLFSIKQLRRLAQSFALLLALQLILGVGNILLSLPLFLAVAHNLVAALLLMHMVMICCRLLQLPVDDELCHRNADDTL